MLSEFTQSAKAAFSRAFLKYAEGIETTTLPNGIRVVTHHIPSILHPLETRQTEFLVQIGVGSLHEKKANLIAGSIHKYEHAAAGGFQHFPEGINIGDNTISGFDGKVHAQTSLDATQYLASTHPDNHKKAVFVLSDITCRPILDSLKIEDDKAYVRAEQIRERMDPYFESGGLIRRGVFGDQASIYLVLGTSESVAAITSDDMHAIRDKYYRSGAIIAVAEGPISHDQHVRYVKKFFNLPPGIVEPAEMPNFIGGYNGRIIPGAAGVHINLAFNCGDDANINHLESLSYDLDNNVRRKLGVAGVSYGATVSHSEIGKTKILHIDFITAPENATKALSLVGDAFDEAANPPQQSKPKLRDVLSRPVEFLKYSYEHNYKHNYKHSRADGFLHPLKTMHSFLIARGQRRGVESLALDLMRKGKIPSENHKLHAVLSTSPADKAALVHKMREERLAVAAEGDLSGFPDYSVIQQIFQIAPQARGAFDDNQPGKTAPSLHKA